MDILSLLAATVCVIVLWDWGFTILKKPRKLYIIHVSYEAEDEMHTAYAFIEILVSETKTKAAFKNRVNDYIQWYEGTLIKEYKGGYTKKSISLESIVPM